MQRSEYDHWTIKALKAVPESRVVSAFPHYRRVLDQLSCGNSWVELSCSARRGLRLWWQAPESRGAACLQRSPCFKHCYRLHVWSQMILSALKIFVKSWYITAYQKHILTLYLPLDFHWCLWTKCCEHGRELSQSIVLTWAAFPVCLLLPFGGERDGGRAVFCAVGRCKSLCTSRVWGSLVHKYLKHIPVQYLSCLSPEAFQRTAKAGGLEVSTILSARFKCVC